MAVPKRRTSKQRKHKRRTHMKAAVPTVVPCPKCGDPMRPHHVCRACGHYGDRVVLEPKEIDS